ncbi:carboxymuconolactone decarboxylase family protein [Kineosporia mesophila]|uniref:Carboxymuconolactone decarboxylase family protein n=1 Tax=Kineosporia mesophila TaxID=566012 RepID=A0ABP6ZLG9_9ACTN|nr:carboxymuconolactone decarboxylase family protein [Kineosporia mesophila]MCD5354471.1 carboxymuconolactone decarboxylase family protein [Kineosporia mesophila]
MTTEERSAASPAPGPDLRTAGENAMRAAMPGVFPDGPISLRDGKLGEELVDIGTTSVWGSLWAREQLAPRDRSLITIAMLIALGAETELKTHVRIGLTNGLTREDIAEVIYHSAGYAGFPRAVAARTATREALGE